MDNNTHHASTSTSTSTSKPKNKNKILKMLPKAMSFGHRVPPFSPDLHHNHNTTSSSNNKPFFSGPMVLVPNAARVRRNKSDAVWDEPTSPKVSCIGQIKLVKSKRSSPKKNTKESSSSLTKEDDDKGRRLSKLKRLFSFSSSSAGGNTSVKPHPTTVAEHPVTVVSSEAAPSLGQMKKFASSRDALGRFDWEVEKKHEEEESPADHRRGYFSDDERRSGGYMRDDKEEEEDDIIIPLSMKPIKQEVNLWKRRTMDPPKPLRLHTS
ncbi:hypothetical protein Bca52824_024967 [Brassica carinata]|uniref:Uncharacterized protein n=1 Tax=Brassica carinata TaxID=52824 RepID=A0A8X7VM67_BRACI|nr:hypothetical protein Bca52824_024967 [Brassica carinata]